MDAGERTEVPLQLAAGETGKTRRHSSLVRTRPLHSSDVQIYRLCEDLTEILVYSMVVFGPWAFGTTERWSIQTMSFAGYGLGVLLAIKVWIRFRHGYQPARWDTNMAGNPNSEIRNPRNHCGEGSRVFSALLGALTVLILAYCLVSAVNVRARYSPETNNFEYYDCITWLPHSFDGRASWLAFWTFLGLACSFWAVWDWLPGKTDGEERPGRDCLGRGSADPAPLFPARLRRLLWVLALNGGLLGVESIVQRLDNCPRLLFLMTPRIHQTAETQFGPYAYRANAAQYFNLLWPVCVGFWWMLNRSYGTRRKAYHALLICAAIMAACPIISTSRGGAIVSLGITALGAALLGLSYCVFTAGGKESRRNRTVTLSALGMFFVAALALGFAMGWKGLRPRMAALDEGFEGRERTYRIVRKIADDYPLFGTGPGTFESVSELYRPRTDEFWPAQAHNDWLETRITFGWVGSLLIYAALATMLLRWFARGGIHGGRRFMILTWLALAGCLVHARFDFPFQVHSILFLFLLLCAIVFNLARRA
jgi:hypothetical protein